MRGIALAALLLPLAARAECPDVSAEPLCWATSMTPTACWPAVPGAHHYALTISQPTGAPIVYFTDIPGATQLRFPCPPARPFKFTIRGVAEDGTLGLVSEESVPVYCGNAFDSNGDGLVNYSVDNKAYLDVYYKHCAIPKP